MLITGLLIPFAGTTLGAAAVFLMKNEINNKIEKLLLGFASGVMLAASFWSLIVPSIEMSQNYKLVFIPCATGFLLGIIILLLLEKALSKINKYDLNNNTSMMFLAVTLHNIPEGMAVGVTLAAALNSNSDVTRAAAIALSVGIAVQNLPEGAIISMPLKSNGKTKVKAFILGSLSGAVEPIFGFLTILLTSLTKTFLPYFLSFAAGAMIYVTASDLIPQAQKGNSSSLGIYGLSLGFTVMMILDVSLG